ncbi:MAG: hypothetical protein ACYTGV_08855 [Planctomycetota bacterium]
MPRLNTFAESEALVALRAISEKWRGKTVSIVLKIAGVAWTSDPDVNGYAGDQLSSRFPA